MTRRHRKLAKTPDLRANCAQVVGSVVTVSRGVRVPEKRFMEIYEIWRSVRKNSHVQMNEVFSRLLELGLRTYEKLPDHAKANLFQEAKRSRCQVEAVDRAASYAVALARLDDRLGFALPRPMKAVLRDEKERTGVSMGRQIRQVLSSNPAKNRSVRSQSVS